MKRVIAIYHIPQECGDAILDFVSLEYGEVKKRINMEGVYPELGEVIHEENTGEFERHCFSCRTLKEWEDSRFQVGNIYERDFGYYWIIREVNLADDEEWSKLVGTPMSTCTVLVERVKVIREYEYKEELDPFGQYLKSIGIDIPWDSELRQDVVGKLIPLIARVHGYDLVNVLQY